jgi:hypothetical protein
MRGIERPSDTAVARQGHPRPHVMTAVLRIIGTLVLALPVLIIDVMLPRTARAESASLIAVYLTVALASPFLPAPQEHRRSVAWFTAVVLILMWCMWVPAGYIGGLVSAFHRFPLVAWSVPVLASAGGILMGLGFRG